MQDNWVALLTATAIALATLFTFVRQYRARKRWFTALDAYVDRELAQERRQRALKGVSMLS
jgi:hypothetical protein